MTAAFVCASPIVVVSTDSAGLVELVAPVEPVGLAGLAGPVEPAGLGPVGLEPVEPDRLAVVLKYK